MPKKEFLAALTAMALASAAIYFSVRPTNFGVPDLPLSQAVMSDPAALGADLMANHIERVEIHGYVWWMPFTPSYTGVTVFYNDGSKLIHFSHQVAEPRPNVAIDHSPGPHTPAEIQPLYVVSTNADKEALSHQDIAGFTSGVLLDAIAHTAGRRGTP